MEYREQCGGHTVIVREASHQDVDAIRGIVTAIYGDNGDYVYDQYHELLHTLQSFCAVAEINGKVIGFGFATLREDNETIYNGGGRILPQYQGKRVMNALNRFIIKEYYSRVKPRQVVSATHMLSSTWTEKIKENFIVVNAVGNMVDIRRSLSTAAQHQPTTKEDHTNIIQLPHLSWQHLVRADDLCKLFPYQFYRDHCAIEHVVTPDTLHHLINSSDQVLISVQPTAQKTSEVGKLLNAPKGISFTKIHMSTDSRLVWLQFALYGHTDGLDLQRHFAKAVEQLDRRLSPSFQGRVRIQIRCPFEIGAGTGEGLCRAIGCSTLYNDITTRALHIGNAVDYLAHASKL